MSCTAKAMNQMTARTSDFDAVIVGLGNTGLSCVRFLAGSGKHLAVTDTRDEPPCLKELKVEFPHVYVSLGRIDTELLLKTDNIIVSPGLSIKESSIEERTKDNVSVFGDIELFCQHVNAPVIAITGSNGKSTVTTLLAKIARDAGLNIKVGGNLGTPALDLLGEDKPDFYILELSSFQLDTRIPSMPVFPWS